MWGEARRTGRKEEEIIDRLGAAVAERRENCPEHGFIGSLRLDSDENQSHKWLSLRSKLPPRVMEQSIKNENGGEGGGNKLSVHLVSQQNFDLFLKALGNWFL